MVGALFTRPGRRPRLSAPARRVTLAALLLAAACGGEPREPALFELLPAERTGVTFANTVATNDTLNVQTDVYVYNGAGVAVGDIDNDGLADVYLAGNLVSSRLYLNKGGMRFEDITERAGVGTDRWATGVTTVDINDDGYLDLYVSVSGPEWTPGPRRANLLFVNNGDRTFTESAASYGIADTSFTTHAAFLDYDGDGCLDLFLLNNSPRDFARRSIESHPAGLRGQTPGSYNNLYRNGCDGRFTDVSEAAGILRDAGYGLGVAVADLNRDGRPDVYVSNDGEPNDVLYANNGDGTFTNRAASWVKHASVAGMGVDVADVNDDGWPDVMQVDMLPRDLEGRKRTTGYVTAGSLMDARGRGFRDDYTANSLQLNNGVSDGGGVVFSEVASLAGVAGTEWSWAPLFADFDRDGRKDLFITNGYPKAVNDLDYENAMIPLRRGGAAGRRAGYQVLGKLYTYDVSNRVLRNEGDLTFADRTAAWGIDRPSFSYGAAYADLDNDGRLDLVVNNIDAPAFVYHNVGPQDEAHHWLQVRLEGAPPRRLTGGIGAALTLTAGGRKQHAYHTPYRGYMSSMDDRVYFGLGASPRVDTLEVTWPDGRVQVLTGLAADRVLQLKQTDAVRRPPAPSASSDAHVFEALDASQAIAHLHHPTTLDDYDVQPLLPYLLSREGPALAVGDATGDGLDDVYVGGGPHGAAKLFVQQKDGRFVASAAGAWARDSVHEDWGALLVDVNGDGLRDLYVASGGYHLAPGSPLLQDRLYVNAGGGAFRRDTLALPAMHTSTAAVRAGDFNGDGRPDLFVGGRLTPRQYPFPTRSYVLRNDGGRFTDVTASVLPELADSAGMITDAAWVDFDGDERLDLVTVGEWMPVRFYRNDGARLRDVTASTKLPPMRGWWSALAVGDFDHDGRPDLVAGNLGLNSLLTASPERPLGVYAANFTGNQTTHVVLTTKVDGVEHTLAGLAPLGREIYSLGLRFPTYGAFARATLADLFPAAQLQQAVHYEADTFASVFLHNTGSGAFAARALPNLAQISPIRGIVVHDVDGDGRLDLVVAGNRYDVEPNTPRLDAGNGLWLRGDGRGQFTPVPPAESGFLAPLNVAGLAQVNTPRGPAVVVANTGDSVQTFVIRRR